jgi:hypothetical protein
LNKNLAKREVKKLIIEEAPKINLAEESEDLN